VEDVFRELVYLPELCLHPHFELEVVLVTANEFWMDDGRGSWRRKRWSVYDRRLLQVLETRRFTGRDEYLALLPDDLPPRFTTRELAARKGLSRRLAQKLVYCYRNMGLLTVRGTTGRTRRYAVTAPRPPLESRRAGQPTPPTVPERHRNAGPPSSRDPPVPVEAGRGGP
jgi:hypothetical protein